jgi:hypothetical protein
MVTLLPNIDGGLYKFSEGYSTSVDSISDKGLSIKKGFKFVRFEDGKKQETGEIEKVNIVADGNLYVMFNNRELHGGWTKGFYVIAQSAKDLESIEILPIEFTPVSIKDKKSEDFVLSYLESNNDYRSYYEIFHSDSNVAVNAIKTKDNSAIKLVKFDKKLKYSVRELIAFILPDDQIQVMANTRFIEALQISGDLYYLLLNYGPETGYHSYILYKFEKQKLIQVFSDSGFST